MRFARRALSGSSKSAWAGGTCVVRGKLTLMGHGATCHRLQRAKDKAWARGLTKEHPMQRTRTYEAESCCWWFCRCGSSSCAHVHAGARFSALSVYACMLCYGPHHETQHLWDLGRTTGREVLVRRTARHDALRCTCIGSYHTGQAQHQLSTRKQNQVQRSLSA